jgi:hypothetical protein
VCLLVLLALGAGRVGAAEKPYVVKVGPALVYLDVGARQGAAVGDIYAVVRPEEREDALVGLVTLIRVEENFCIAEIGYRVEGEQFELLQRAMTLEEWEAGPAMPHLPEPEHHAQAESHAHAEEGHAEHGRWGLHLMGGMEWPAEEEHSERSLGLSLGFELSRWVGLDLGFKLAGELPEERSQYIGELSAKVFPFGSEGVRPYLGGGPSLRRLSHHGETTIKWGGQVLGGVAAPLGSWRLMVEGGYQRVAAWSGITDVSGWLGQVGVGVHF